MTDADLSDNNTQAGPLAGVTVVTLEQAVSAPMCTRTLADFGARVIKVGEPERRRLRPALRRCGERAGRALRVGQPGQGIRDTRSEVAGRDRLLHRLLDGADALVSNLAPGATARLGLSPADVAQRHPDLIAVEIDGYGQRWPVVAQAGVRPAHTGGGRRCAVTGSRVSRPNPVRRWRMSPPGSTRHCRSSRCCTRGIDVSPGNGSAQVKVSLFDTVAEVMGYQLNYTPHSGVDQQPLGMSSPAVAPYGSYPTADGQTVVLGTTNDSEWQRWHGKSSAATTSPTMPGSRPTAAGWRIGMCSRRPSAPGAANTISAISSASRTTRVSVTRDTTCRAR